MAGLFGEILLSYRAALGDFPRAKTELKGGKVGKNTETFGIFSSLSEYTLFYQPNGLLKIFVSITCYPKLLFM